MSLFVIKNPYVGKRHFIGEAGGNLFRQKGCPPDPLPKTFKLCKLIICSVVVTCINLIYMLPAYYYKKKRERKRVKLAFPLCYLFSSGTLFGRPRGSPLRLAARFSNHVGIEYISDFIFGGSVSHKWKDVKDYFYICSVCGRGGNNLKLKTDNGQWGMGNNG
jgi:hypothetical protein